MLAKKQETNKTYYEEWIQRLWGLTFMNKIKAISYIYQGGMNGSRNSIDEQNPLLLLQNMKHKDENVQDQTLMVA